MSAAGSGPAVAVITGGAGSLGLACARLFADGPVILSDLSEERLATAAAELRAEGLTVGTHAGNVTDAEAVAELVRQVAGTGPLGALVHTAGLSGAMGTADEVLSANLVGTLRILDGFEPLVGPGSVGVMIASVGGHRRFARQYDEILCTATADDAKQRLTAAGGLGLHSRAAYGISKRGIILQVQRRARSWGALGGRLVSVSPGLLSDSTMGGLVQTTGGESRAYADRSALGRAGTVDDVAQVVRFLSSPSAAYVSGIDVLVDGGVLAHTDHWLAVEPRLRWHGAPVSD